MVASVNTRLGCTTIEHNEACVPIANPLEALCSSVSTNSIQSL